MSEKRTQTPLARAQIVAIGILMSMISMAALGVVFAIGLIDSNAAIEDVATSKIVANVLLAVGFIALGLSYGLRTKLAKKDQFTSVVIGMAVGEFPAVLALANGLLTENYVASLVLGVTAIASALLHFPRASEFR